MRRHWRSTHWRRRIAVYSSKYHLEGAMLLGTAVFVGFAAGIGAIVFRWLIATVSHLSFEVLPRLTGPTGRLHIVLAPALGGLLVGPLVWFFAREAKGHGSGGLADQSVRDQARSATRRDEPSVDYETILYRLEDHIVTITLNRPELRNCINQQMNLELQDAFKRFRTTRRRWWRSCPSRVSERPERRIRCRPPWHS